MKLKEVVAKSIIEKSGVNCGSVKVMVDLGAWEGSTPYWFAKAFPNAEIYAIEPVIESFELLQKTVVERYLTKVIPVLCAVSDKSGLQTIHLCENSRSNSLLEGMATSGELSERKIIGLTWDDLMDMLNLKEVDFCKVNIEGAEIEMFKGMTKVFPKLMALESHSRKGLGDDYKKELEFLIKEKGYRVIDKGKITYILAKGEENLCLGDDDYLLKYGKT
jgi:FkbM family methyltransferase